MVGTSTSFRIQSPARKRFSKWVLERGQNCSVPESVRR
jgi:hypothetical protein